MGLEEGGSLLEEEELVGLEEAGGSRILCV
jgi:hypothetical protein